MFQNLFDSHSHSENSPDGTHSVTFMAETAVEKGIHGLAITDHCECDGLKEYNFELRMRHSAVDVALAKAAFRNLVILTNGIELGQPGYDMAGAERLLELVPYDFVLLSLHRLQGGEDFFTMDFTAMTGDAIHKMLLQYFEELLGLIRWGYFDVLAHLTFPLRYLKNSGIDIDLYRYAEPIDAVLRGLIDCGKGLEINTSGLFGPMESAMPPDWVIRRYLELGGERMTIGSDAHRAIDIGRGIRQGMEMLQAMGCQYFTFYRDRIPVMLRII